MVHRLRVRPAFLFLIVLIAMIPMTGAAADQPLPYWQVVTDVLTTLDSECWPIHDRGTIRFVFKDFDNNGLEDTCVLCAAVSTFEEAE